MLLFTLIVFLFSKTFTIYHRGKASRSTLLERSFLTPHLSQNNFMRELTFPHEVAYWEFGMGWAFFIFF